jgi:hypothetical protein
MLFSIIYPSRELLAPKVPVIKMDHLYKYFAVTNSNIEPPNSQIAEIHYLHALVIALQKISTSYSPFLMGTKWQKRIHNKLIEMRAAALCIVLHYEWNVSTCTFLFLGYPF